MTKPFHAGRAAQAGVIAARLAQGGFTGSPQALEHPRGLLTGISPQGRVDLASPCEAGRDWKLPRTGLNIKKYPLCFAAHRALDGMLDLQAEHRVAAEDVARVRVAISARNKSTLRYERPQTGLEAKFSMQFAMASALIAGRAGLLELRDEFVRRDDVQRLMTRVEVVPDDRDDPRRPGDAPYDVVVLETRSGERFQREVDYARGGPERPLAPGELFSKFESCLAAGGLQAPARPLFDALMSIDELPSAAALYRFAIA